MAAYKVSGRKISANQRDGETWVDEGDGVDHTFINFKFTSKELDEETNLYYFGARYLDPQTSRWISPDPALAKYLPTGNKKIDMNLPRMGGIFNPINLNLYCYTGNSPIRYIDPNGEIPTPRDWFDMFFFPPTTEGNFGRVHRDALEGDKNAIRMVHIIWYDASIKMTNNISDTMDYATIACLAVGFVPGAAACKIVGTSADITRLGIKLADAVYMNDYKDFLADLAIEGISYFIGFVISKKVSKLIIKEGITGRFYQIGIGRKGAIKKWDAIRKKVFKKLAPKIGEEATEEFLKKVYKSYENIKQKLNNNNKDKK